VYQVQVVWNREFHWAPYGDPCEDADVAEHLARRLADSGDGARVKKWRVVDVYNEDNVVRQGV